MCYNPQYPSIFQVVIHIIPITYEIVVEGCLVWHNVIMVCKSFALCCMTLVNEQSVPMWNYLTTWTYGPVFIAPLIIPMIKCPSTWCSLSKWYHPQHPPMIYLSSTCAFHPNGGFPSWATYQHMPHNKWCYCQWLLINVFRHICSRKQKTPR